MKNKATILFGIIFFSGILSWGFWASAATIFTDDFNGYNAGNLNGQGGWSATSAYLVGSNPVKEGAKALRSSLFDNFAPAVKSGASLNDGQITMYVHRFDANQPGIFYFILREGDFPKIEIRGNYGAQGKFQYVDGFTGSYLNFGPSFGYDDWYAIQIQWRSSDHSARYNINGGSWTGWAPALAPWVSGLNTVELDGANAMAWDAIQENLIGFVPKNPVLIVPGLMGTEMKNGDELLWANIPRMLIDSSDSFMDSLAFNPSLTPLNSNLQLTEIIRQKPLTDYTNGLIGEFKNQGYIEGQTLFTFPYDWRYGVSAKNADGKTNSDLLAQKIQDIMAQTGSDKVDVVAHSMGGLIVKKYVMDHSIASHIGKAVFVGVPELGSVKTIKALLLGDNFDISFAGFGLSEAEIKKIAANMPAAYDLLPSQQYYDAKGSFVKVVQKGDFTATQKELNYQDFQNYMGVDHAFNQQALVNADALHSADFDNFDMRPAGIDVYAINGCKIATLDNIVESRHNTTLGSFISSYDLIKFNDGDNTVPIESSASLPVNSDHAFYSLKTKHSDLLSATGSRQEIVNLISGSNLAVGDGITKDSSKCGLNGKVISKHSPVNIVASDGNNNQSGVAADGTIVNNIPGAEYEAFGDQGYLYLPTDDGQTYNISMDGMGTGTYTIKTDDIQNNDVVKTQVFSNLPVTADLTGTINLNGSQDTLTVNQQTILPSSVIVGGGGEDVLAPVSVATASANGTKVTMNATDADSGVLNIWYKLDGGVYQKADGALVNILVAGEGAHIVTYFATDKAGNNEQEQVLKFTIDTTAPEAVIEFDVTKKDLKFSSPEAGIVITDKDDVVTLTDQAGNVTEIKLKDRDRKKSMAAEIKSLTYNGVAADITKNSMQYSWSYDKTGIMKKLSQHVKSRKEYIIDADFDGKNTKVAGKDFPGKISQTFSGLKIIKVITNKGDFNWSY